VLPTGQESRFQRVVEEMLRHRCFFLLEQAQSINKQKKPAQIEQVLIKKKFF